ncbi:MAG: DNA primase [Candidatus Midichloriaceae bacterium]|jgi:DNA primase
MSSDSELIKSKIQISDVIGRKLSLKNRGGDNFLALCPFHKEKTPSFSVSDSKGIFHCFGCGINGDVFTFLMKHDGISYKEALEKLAETAGLTLTKKVKNDPQTKLVSKCFEIHLFVSNFYHEILFSKDGEEAMKYIKSRNISIDTIKCFKIGFSPKNSNILLNKLKEVFTMDELLQSGAIQQKNDHVYDPFYNRITFPIHDQFGKCIGFGGRTLGEQQPKYLNSSENPIFKKSANLYGYSLAKTHIHKSSEVLVVEGYMDVIALANIGIKHVVAPLGANIKASQIEMLWKVCSEPTICFDNDLAGKNAMKKIAYDILTKITYDKSLQFIHLTGWKDPDEIIQNKGVEFFQEVLKKSLSIADYLFDIESQKIPLNTPEKKILLKKNLEKVENEIQDLGLRKAYSQHFKSKYYDLLRSLLKKNKTNNWHLEKTKIPMMPTNKIKDFENHIIIGILLNYPIILEDNELFEEVIAIDLPNYLDKIRSLVLNASPIINAKKPHNIIYEHSVICNNEYRDYIKGKLEQMKISIEFLTKNDVIVLFKKALCIKKIQMIKKELELLKKELLITFDSKLMTKMLFLKEYEKELENLLQTT